MFYFADHDTHTVGTGHRSVRLHPVHRAGHRPLPHRAARRPGRGRPYVGRQGRRTAAGVRPGHPRAGDRLRRRGPRRHRHLVDVGLRAGQGTSRSTGPSRSCSSPSTAPTLPCCTPSTSPPPTRCRPACGCRSAGPSERVGAITDIACFEPAQLQVTAASTVLEPGETASSRSRHRRRHPRRARLPLRRLAGGVGVLPRAGRGQAARPALPELREGLHPAALGVPRRTGRPRPTRWSCPTSAR